MTMHICHPSLSLNGKKKGKKKFRSSEAAQRARVHQEEWEDLKARWGCAASQKQSAKPEFKEYKPKPNPLMQLRGAVEKGDREASWDPCVKQESRKYTGEKVLGVGTLHKSNAVPIFSEQEAKDLSSMRR